MNKPFAPAADRNKEPILNVLQHELTDDQIVLEIGSGNGQHACYFAARLPQIKWQPTELKSNLAIINEWISDEPAKNILPPLELDVNRLPWPTIDTQVCFTCNTFHIISMDSVKSIFRESKVLLGYTGKLCVYGPFTIHGKHTSDGNVQFDKQLRESNPESGIKDLNELDDIAQKIGFSPCRKVDMPANNFFIVWEIL